MKIKAKFMGVPDGRGDKQRYLYTLLVFQKLHWLKDPTIEIVRSNKAGHYSYASIELFFKDWTEIKVLI